MVIKPFFAFSQVLSECEGRRFVRAELLYVNHTHEKKQQQETMCSRLSL